MKQKRRKKVCALLAVYVISIGFCICTYTTTQTITVLAENYEYDNLNRVTKVTYDDGSTVTYTYDANGNIMSVVTTPVQPSSSAQPTNPTQPTNPAKPDSTDIGNVVQEVINTVKESISNIVSWATDGIKNLFHRLFG